MQIHEAIRLLKEACALQHTALQTEKSYTHWLVRYASFLKGPEARAHSGPEQKIEAFLTTLALKGVSASTQNQAFNALLFFYRCALKLELGSINSLRAKRPAALRYCPTREETLQLLAHTADVHGYPTRLIVHLLYACGLRVSEPLNLRIKDLDLRNRRLHIHQAKGNKGRVVNFPDCLSAPLQRQLAVAKAAAAQDLAKRIPVALPGLLGRKYPYAAHAERWGWLFPSRNICFDRRANKFVRWRCHESNVQRAVRAAAQRCRLQGLTPHNLRHAFASHALQDGAFVRDLQVVLGHNHLETTMLYLHTEAGRVASPLKNYNPGLQVSVGVRWNQRLTEQAYTASPRRSSIGDHVGLSVSGCQNVPRPMNGRIVRQLGKRPEAARYAHRGTGGDTSPAQPGQPRQEGQGRQNPHGP